MGKPVQTSTNVSKNPVYVPNIVQILPEVTIVNVMIVTTKDRMMSILVNVKIIQPLGLYSPTSTTSEIYL